MNDLYIIYATETNGYSSICHPIALISASKSLYNTIRDNSSEYRGWNDVAYYGATTGKDGLLWHIDCSTTLIVMSTSLSSKRQTCNYKEPTFHSLIALFSEIEAPLVHLKPLIREIERKVKEHPGSLILGAINHDVMKFDAAPKK